MLDLFTFLVSVFLFAIYSTILVLSIIFSFFIETYRQIDEQLKLEIIPAGRLSPLEQNINWLDAWLMAHNKLVGLPLIALCIIDIKFSFDIIDMLYML